MELKNTGLYPNLKMLSGLFLPEKDDAAIETVNSDPYLFQGFNPLPFVCGPFGGVQMVNYTYTIIVKNGELPAGVRKIFTFRFRKIQEVMRRAAITEAGAGLCEQASDP